MSGIYGLVFSETALKYLECEVPTKIQGQIKRRIESLASNPTPPGSKKLQGISDGVHPIYRLRQGDYRILYVARTNHHEIVVLDIGHRKDVYR